jgi:hypothetical protein
MARSLHCPAPQRPHKTWAISKGPRNENSIHRNGMRNDPLHRLWLQSSGRPLRTQYGWSQRMRLERLCQSRVQHRQDHCGLRRRPVCRLMRRWRRPMRSIQHRQLLHPHRRLHSLTWGRRGTWGLRGGLSGAITWGRRGTWGLRGGLSGAGSIRRAISHPGL